MSARIPWTTLAAALLVPSMAAAQAGSTTPTSGSTTSPSGTTASSSSAAAGTASSTASPSAAPATSAPARRAEDEDDEDDENHFWIDVAAGYSWINLVALNQSGLTPTPETVKSSGYGVEAGLGLQFSIVRFGAQGSYARYQSFDAATAELTLQLVIPTPLVQPYLSTGFGYAWITNVDQTSTMTGQTSTVPIHGIAIDLGLGLDFQLSDTFQLGVGVEASFLNLQRQKVTDLGQVLNVDFTKPGNSVGLQIMALGRATLQF